MIKQTLKAQAGFTLAEMLVAATFSLALLASVYSFFRSQTHSIKGQESRMEASEYALSVLDMIVREIRNTGSFPTGTACTNVSNTAGIVAAGSQNFQLVYDSNGDGSCEENISFSYDAANKNVLRNGTAMTDGNATAFSITYYPRQTGSTAPAPYCFSANNPAGCSGTLSANLNNVQTATLTITIRAKSPDTTFGSQSTLTMTASTNFRNRGL